MVLVHCHSAPLMFLFTIRLSIWPVCKSTIADIQRNFILLVEVFPEIVGECVDVSWEWLDPLRLALEGGNGAAVADIGVDKMAQAGQSRIAKGKAAARRSFGVGAFEDAHFIGEVPVFKRQKATDSGGEVGRIRLKARGSLAPQKSSCRALKAFIDGVGLIAVGDDELVVQRCNGRGR